MYRPYPTLGLALGLVLGLGGCASKSPVAQTSRGVAADKPAPIEAPKAVVAKRLADVPDVTDPDEVLIIVRAGSIWMIKPSGQDEPFQLTSRSLEGVDRSPSLTPAGDKLVYAAPVDGIYRVHVLSLDEMDPQPVTADQPGQQDQPTWAPDGKRVAYMSGEPEEQRHLIILDLETGKTEILVKGKDNEPKLIGTPAWSPDGSQIAFISDRRHGRGALLWVVDVASKRLRRLTSPLPDGWFVRERDPTWSPDGKRLAFASNRHVKNADDADDFDIYAINADGSGLTRLTSDPGVATDPAYSVDGKRLFFVSTRDSKRAFETEIFVMAAEGGKQRRLTREERPQNSAPFSARAK